MVTVTIQYSPSRIWEILQDGSEDFDEILDVEAAMERLSDQHRLFIRKLAGGYSGAEAMEIAHLTGNQTRLKRLVLLKLTTILNGVSIY